MSLRIVTAATAAACLLAFGAGVPAARASADDNNEDRGRSTTVSGQLQAAGGGSVTLDGRFVSFGLVAEGDGEVRVTDRAGDASVRINGRSISLKRGVTTAVELDSGKRFYLSGSQFRVAINGHRYVLNASGFGTAVLSGSGYYILNSGRPQSWSGTAALRLGAGPDPQTALRVSDAVRKADEAAARAVQTARRAKQAARKAVAAARKARQSAKRARGSAGAEQAQKRARRAAKRARAAIARSQRASKRAEQAKKQAQKVRQTS
ncbi:MAG: hypothetical protein R2878_04165 [Thermoleophilia bacterium]